MGYIGQALVFFSVTQTLQKQAMPNVLWNLSFSLKKVLDSWITVDTNTLIPYILLSPGLYSLYKEQ